MDNGCACCTVRGDLVKALIGLKDRRKDFDAVLLETTGLADPAPILQTFESNPVLQNNYRIDCVTTLVDVKFIKQHLDEVRPEGTVNEAVQQVAFADRVVLNKVDLISRRSSGPSRTTCTRSTRRERTACAQLAAAASPQAALPRSSALSRSSRSTRTLSRSSRERSRAPLDRIIDQSAYSIDRIDEMLPGEYEAEVEEARGGSSMACDDGRALDDAHGHGHASARRGGEPPRPRPRPGARGVGRRRLARARPRRGPRARPRRELVLQPATTAPAAATPPPPKKKKHDLSGVGSLGLTTSQPLDAEKFNKFMNALLQAKAKDLYRSKGVLQFTNEGDTKFVFQGVHEQIDFTSAKQKWTADEPMVSKIVFIGRDLDRDALEKGFRFCYDDEPTATPGGAAAAPAWAPTLRGRPRYGRAAEAARQPQKHVSITTMREVIRR